MSNLRAPVEEEQVRAWMEAERQRTDSAAAELCRHVAQLTASPPDGRSSRLLLLTTRDHTAIEAATVVLKRMTPEEARALAADTAILTAVQPELRAVMALILVPRWIYAVFSGSLLCSTGLLLLHWLLGSAGWPALLPVLPLDLSWGLWLYALLARLRFRQQKPMRVRDLFCLHRGLLEISLVLGRQGITQQRIVSVPKAAVLVAVIASVLWLLFSALLLGLYEGPLVSEPLVLLGSLHLLVMGLWGLVMWRYERAQKALG